MILTAPIYRLKRQARVLSRQEEIPLHEALNRIAQQEGYETWSLLARRAAEYRPGRALIEDLQPGDLILLGARPGQGKTLLGLELAIEAMKQGRQGAFYTLEFNESDINECFHTVGEQHEHYRDRFLFEDSDDLNASLIMNRLAEAAAGTLAVIDYLQLLDQKRENPPLTEQIAALKVFASERGLILVFLAQIHRSFEQSDQAFPVLADVRLPNPLDLNLFNKACFLNEGEISVAAVG